MTQENQGEEVVCPRCAVQFPHRGGKPADASVINCPKCDARVAYGALMPRVVIAPDADVRFVSVMFGDAEPVRLDKAFATMVGHSLISVGA